MSKNVSNLLKRHIATGQLLVSEMLCEYTACCIMAELYETIFSLDCSWLISNQSELLFFDWFGKSMLPVNHMHLHGLTI